MALYTETAWSYSETQADFIKYFERLLSTGMSFKEIHDKLPQLENYYQEMVLDLINGFNFKQSIYDLFKNWKKNR